MSWAEPSPNSGFFSLLFFCVCAYVVVLDHLIETFLSFSLSFWCCFLFVVFFFFVLKRDTLSFSILLSFRIELLSFSCLTVFFIVLSVRLMLCCCCCCWWLMLFVPLLFRVFFVVSCQLPFDLTLYSRLFFYSVNSHSHTQPHKIDINNYCYVKQSVFLFI